MISGGLILWLGKRCHNTVIRWVALVAAIITLGLCIPLCGHFDTAHYAMQYIETMTWMPALGITYSLGVDGLSVVLITLTTFTTVVVILASWNSITSKVSQYMAAFLVMQGLLVGVFAAMDAIVFYIFWEATLIPMYLIIGIWGSDNRVYAALKFFIYTFLGSVLMLGAFLYMGYMAGSFSITDFYHLKLGMTAQSLIFLAFFLGFAIKIPMFPVHTWLPDAHTEAPAGGSVVLAAIFDCSRLYRLYRDYPTRYEKADCIFVHIAYGFCYAGVFCDFCYCTSISVE